MHKKSEANGCNLGECPIDQHIKGFETLGAKVRTKAFHKNVVASLIGKIPTKSETTQFGIKHIYNAKLTSKDGKSVSVNVVVVIQKDNGRTTYKIVTVYPDKKGK